MNDTTLALAKGELAKYGLEAEIRLEEGLSTDIWLYGYTGPAIPSAKLYVSTVVIEPVPEL